MGRIHPRHVDDLLSIGEFASRCGLSAKMLRSYAAAGLLVPAAVDGFSGYRYYSPGQVHRARVIALLRRAGIAVGDITTFFADPDPARLPRSRPRIRRQRNHRGDRRPVNLAASGHIPCGPCRFVNMFRPTGRRFGRLFVRSSGRVRHSCTTRR
ncbi:MerR family transcriptional regulator [Nocardia terpenica]|uniref:MerR family transcriptional regulator n=1 Tax=Nocardia terpenica TaxID=455432 RepID=UPI003A5C7482